SRDFEEMSGNELAQAQAAVRSMAPLVKPIPGRRFQTHPRGARIDMRKTLRASLRAGADIIPLVRRRQRDRPPSFVVLCDISGSMSTYSRVFLHFAHAMTQRYVRVSTFLFATRLTNVSRCLRDRDVDRALGAAGHLAKDWEGGTRIGQCLHEFNRDWSRRVMAQVPTVLLVSDGLDRDAGEGLTREIERLHKSCRKLIWLNPLLRYDKFQPLAAGIKAILPHVDEFRSIHNLESVAELAAVLSGAAGSHYQRAVGLEAPVRTAEGLRPTRPTLRDFLVESATFGA
ncbi:MAG: VWA domain-containing protein, partial [Rhodospirillaceae bacterium]|nr:VWA domain-containing protein [Rhodospirillaceae bacterium]